MKEAYDFLGEKNNGRINSVLKGDRMTYKGYCWKIKKIMNKNVSQNLEIGVRKYPVIIGLKEIAIIMGEMESHFGTIIYGLLYPIVKDYILKRVSNFEETKNEMLNKYMIAAHDYVNRNRKWKSYDW